MRLRDIYSGQSAAVSIEFFAPKTEQGEANLAARIPVIKSLKPAFCSVTYGAGGGSRNKTLWWVRRFKEEFEIDVMCHLTCVGQSRDEVKGVLHELASMGVDKIIALRGDPPKGVAEWRPHPDGFHHAYELVQAAREIGDFSVAVAGFPEVHPEAESRESDLAYLKEKVEAGAEAIITQLFFDNEDFVSYVKAARDIGITVPIVPGILPFRTVTDLTRFTQVYARSRYGPAKVPDNLAQRAAAVENDDAAAGKLGIDYATEQCRGLLHEGAPGLHFYCMNESHAVEQILTRLRS